MDAVKRMPKVSVIVPVYNTELYVERAIISLMEQTLDNVQFIIIDDGSKDNSLNIIQDVIARYPAREGSVTLISRENLGVAATRAQGMELATGSYIIHLDSDDWAEPEWLEKLYSKAIDENSDVVICNYNAVYENKINAVTMPPDKTGALCLKQLLCDKQRGYTWNKLIHRRIFSRIGDPFIQGINYLEDLLYIMKCFYLSQRISYVPDYLYNYNQQNLISITKGMSDSKVEDIKKTTTFISNFINSHELSQSLNKEMMFFKIKQKTFLIYGQWQWVKKDIWTLFPETEPFILTSPVPIHFKISLLAAKLKLYKTSSLLMSILVRIKFIIKKVSF